VLQADARNVLEASARQNEAVTAALAADQRIYDAASVHFNRLSMQLRTASQEQAAALSAARELERGMRVQ
jgi:hypothetical protein